MAKRKSSPILWVLLGAAGVLTVGVAGTVWWNESLALREQGVEGNRTQNGLRLLARHQTAKAQPPPHPILLFVYGLFKIPWSYSGATPYSLEINLPTPLPLALNQSLPTNISAIAATPDGARFALNIRPASVPRMATPVQAPQTRTRTSNGSQVSISQSNTPPSLPLSRTILVSLPQALPENIPYLDITVTAPGATAKWRVSKFDKLQRQATTTAPTSDIVTIEGTTLRAAAWTFPEGREETVWVQPGTGQTMMRFRPSSMRGNRSPFPNATLTTQKRDPDVITVGVWQETIQDRFPSAVSPGGSIRISARGSSSMPGVYSISSGTNVSRVSSGIRSGLPGGMYGMTRGSGEDPPQTTSPYQQDLLPFNFVRTSTEWDDTTTGSSWHGTIGSSDSLPDGRSRRIQASLSRPDQPGFGGTQKWVKVEGTVDEYQRVATTAVFRDIPVQKSGADLAIALDPAKATAQKDGWTIRLVPTVNKNTPYFGGMYMTGQTSGSVKFSIECVTKQRFGPNSMVEVLYRDESGDWRTITVAPLSQGTGGTRPTIVFAPAPTGGKIRAIAVRCHTSRINSSRPISLILPVQVGKPAQVPERIMEM